MPPSEAEKRKKLYQLARAADVDISPPPRKLCFNKDVQSLVVSRKDRYEAERLINEKARQGRGWSIFYRRAGLLSHLPKYEHVQRALSDHVLSAGSAAVAQALIDRLRWAKKDDRKPRSPNAVTLQHGLLRFSTSVGNTEMIKVLAPHADRQELNTALQVATEMNDRKRQSLLLQHGADPNCLTTYLTQAILSKDTGVFKLLLREGKPLKPSVLEECIKSAIQVENTAVVAVLLKIPLAERRDSEKGARLGWNRDGLLHMAIREEHYKIFVTLAYHTMNTPISDSTLYSRAVKNCQNCSERAASIIQILLCLDVSAICASRFWQMNSSPFDDGLVDTRLLWLLVRYEVPLSCQAFKLAAETAQLNLFIQLLKQHVEDGQVAWESVSLLPTELQALARESIIIRLTQQKTKSDRWADEALIHATKLRRLDWVRTLLNVGASPNHGDGAALKIAVQQQDEAIFKLFLTRPFSDDVSAELVLMMRQFNKEARSSLMRLFLKRPYPHFVITPLLDELLCDRSESRDIDLTMALIESEARCSDKGMTAIVQNLDSDALQRFLKVHQRQVGRIQLHTCSGLFPHFVSTDMQFLVKRIPGFEHPSFRELCFQMLDLHIRYWTTVERGGLLNHYFDMLTAMESSPVDSNLVNLFGKYQRYLPLSHQSKITGIIVCSQPESIASAFVRTFASQFPLLLRPTQLNSETLFIRSPEITQQTILQRLRNLPYCSHLAAAFLHGLSCQENV